MPSPELSATDKQLVQKLSETNFHGYAKVKLGKLSADVVDELLRVSFAPEKPPLGADSTSDQKVACLLQIKKAVQKTAPPKPLPPVAANPSAAPPAAAPAAPRPPPPTSNPVFSTGHGISIVAFNSLKLRMDHVDLKDEWDAAVLEFAKHDVLLLSEVRAGDRHYRARVLRLIEMLEDCTEDRWTWQMSEPSNSEVHLLIVKRPIDIVQVQTLKVVDGLNMDYAPLVACIDDPRFEGGLNRFCITSLHMPPNSGTTRRSQRDAQIAKLVSLYPARAEFRFGLAFTDQAAKESRQKRPHVAHILGGDFNASASELRDLGVERHGWEAVFGNVSTSSGGKSYDNFLINRDAKNHLILSSQVLHLTRFANFSRSQQGISDHSPIVLRLTELPPRPSLTPTAAATATPTSTSMPRWTRPAALQADPGQSDA